ncbi:MAG: RICIN domain-containing protein [Alloacidobacterium sp.]|jgi:uncharacterized repeat protein (TIGR01451 family)
MKFTLTQRKQTASLRMVGLMLAIAPTILIVLTVLLISLNEASAQTDVLTWHNDNYRNGLNSNEAILTPANVGASTFGLRFNFIVDGKVDAEPLYVMGVRFPTQGVHNVVYVVTENNSVYAIDADTGKQYWHVTALVPGEMTSDDRGCTQVSPKIGITATPVIDPKAGPHGTIYFVSMSKDYSGKYHHRLHAQDLTTGAEEFGGPREVQATYVGKGDNSSNGTVIFDPAQYKDRPGLLLLNGVIYTSWGSHCDVQPYTSWMIGYNESNLQQTSVINFTPNGSQGAPWNAGAGPAADTQGNIYISLGNGTFDTTTTASGFPYLADYGNSLVKLNMLNGRLSVADYWTMYDTVDESNTDTDLSSGGTMLLQDMTDTTGTWRHLAVAAGKDGNLYVVDRDKMGHFHAGSNATVYQDLAGALPGGVWGSPAFFNNQIYYGPTGQPVMAFQINSARVSSSPVSSTAVVFNYPGATPSVSAYGNTNGIVWATKNTDPAVLYAFDARNLSTQLYDSYQTAHFGVGNKFITPMIANGKVYVGTTTSVAAFGLLTTSTPPLADGDYTLTNSSSGMALADPAHSTLSGAQMIQWNPTEGMDMKWFFSSQGNAYYVIQNIASGLLLTDTNGSTTPLTPLVQRKPTYDDSQLWALIAVNGGYIVQNKASGLVIENPESSQSAGTGMVLDQRNNGVNQVWTFGADLFLRIWPSTTTVHPGDLLTYSFPVWNLGSANAVHEVLNTQVPAGTTFDNISILGTPGLGTCTTPPDGGTGQIVCHENATMAVNATWTVSLTVKVTASAGTVITESAATMADTPDPNLANNTATVSLTVVP